MRTRNLMNERIKDFRECTNSSDDGQATFARILLSRAQRRKKEFWLKPALGILFSVAASSVGFAAFIRYREPTPTMSARTETAHIANQSAAPSSMHVSNETALPPTRTVGFRQTPKSPIRPQTEDEWYERAHRLHFHSNETRRALSAWLAYLSRYPQGSFANEATFNRAVCLAKLGDREGAVDALLPLARGNTSRASAARRLLEALDSRP